MLTAPPWALEVRRFIATGDDRFLASAGIQCDDASVLRFLNYTAEEAQPALDRDEWEPLVRNLDREGRKVEAIVLNLLAAANLAQAGERSVRPDAPRWLQSICKDAARASADIGFPECEARFSLALGTCHINLGDWGAANQALSRSVKLYRSLVQAEPTAYRPNLAASLEAFGIVADEQGNLEAARRRYLEAIEIRRGLERDNPGRHAPELMGTLTALGNLLRHHGRFTEAEEVFDEINLWASGLPAETRGSFFIPERPSLDELESARGVQRLIGQVLGYLEERGGNCHNCGTRIDPRHRFSFVPGQPAPRLACSKAACVASLQRFSETVLAPMLTADKSGGGQ